MSAALSSDLAALTAALDQQGIDLATQLDQLSAGLKLACLGMTITISGDGKPATFSAEDAASISSVEAPSLTAFSPAMSSEPGNSFVRFEAATDVYIDTAVDARDTTGINNTALDPDSRAATRASGVPTVLQRRSTINQAIGTLLERGRTPEAAHEALAQLANFGHTDLYRAAVYLLRDLAGHHPTDEGAPAAA